MCVACTFQIISMSIMEGHVSERKTLLKKVEGKTERKYFLSIHTNSLHLKSLTKLSGHLEGNFTRTILGSYAD